MKRNQDNSNSNNNNNNNNKFNTTNSTQRTLCQSRDQSEPTTAAQLQARHLSCLARADLERQA
tara:strand:+ start:363 stop:551 length:189 start_codon:yes stop_codon:yes gene_type:complete